MHPYFGEFEVDYPLHHAAAVGTVEDIKRVLDDPKRVIDVHLGGVYRESPLHWAAARGDIEAARFLLANGFYASSTDRNSDGPAEIAGRHNHLEMKALLENERTKEEGKPPGFKSRIRPPRGDSPQR